MRSNISTAHYDFVGGEIAYVLNSTKLSKSRSSCLDNTTNNLQDNVKVSLGNDYGCVL